MNIFAHILLLSMGAYIVYSVFDYETRLFKVGRTNPYLNVRKSFCSLEDFEVMLRKNVFKKLFFRFVLIGILFGGFYIYARYLDLNFTITDLEREGFSIWIIFTLWVTGTMMTMTGRSQKAFRSGIGLPR